ncbi:hypothetical protein RF11_01212 [Thelohanellus kitauei]|uniref:Uncharacterized protein n=1 Tax=Thelohanellus kitauei TaxID=669202 RepID=A0A0C2MNY9_THEKT|nr:hypothetical protein RF11_01212 [Thelohanellus kitauei]
MYHGSDKCCRIIACIKVSNVRMVLIFFDLWSYNPINCVWKRYEPPIDTRNHCASFSICLAQALVIINDLLTAPFKFDITCEKSEIICPHSDDYDENRPLPKHEYLLLYYNGFLYLLETT